MKNIIALIFTVILSNMLLAQAPEKISYQFVVRNNNGVLITNSNIGIQISILQFTINGSAVYVEKHNTMTNMNGLANIEIGGGTPISGIFAAIDWSNGPFFLKTETSPGGGTNYTITGTSQLLSVPYALYAKTAESLVGGLVESDPVFTLAPAFGISATNIVDWNMAFGWGNHAGLYLPFSYLPDWVDITNNPFAITGPALNQILKFDGTNWVNELPDFAATNHIHGDATGTESGFMSGPDKTKLDVLQNADGSETILAAGTDITISGDGTGTNPYVIGSTAGNIRHIGELFGGGIVFYVDETGEHGLICSLIDLSTAYIWSNANGQISGNTWDGQANTNAIVGQSGMTSSAAKLCDDYTNADYGTGIFSDWYLPAIAQIETLNNSCYKINMTLENDGDPLTETLSLLYYWTSNDYYTNQSLAYFMVAGSAYFTNKSDSHYVRAVRTF